MWWLGLALVAVLILLTVGRSVSRPYVMLPPMSVAADDPAMLAAVHRARELVPTLRAEFGRRPDDTTVKFAFATDTGTVEHVWARLLQFEHDDAVVRIITAPVHHEGPDPGPIKVPVGSLEDWQVEQPDGSIVGGFTIRAMGDIARSRGIPSSREFDKHMARYRDA